MKYEKPDLNKIDIDNLDLIIYPDKRLEWKSFSVDSSFDKKLVQRLIDRMSDVMYKGDGVGLAAILIGIPLRIIIADVYDKKIPIGVDIKKVSIEDRKNLRVLINPTITYYSKEKREACEGCLSSRMIGEKLNSDDRFDNYFENNERKILKTIRSSKVIVSYVDINGKSQELEAEGLLAQCLQHEIDLTNGIFYIQRLSDKSKEIAKIIFENDPKSIKKVEEGVL